MDYDSWIMSSIKVYREKYIVFAKFTEDQNARLFADVVDRDFLEAPIDAYLIMINPGSSKAKETHLPISEYYKNLDVVEAVSDRALKCVMAFMDLCGIKKIRILNLMDYRSSNYDKALSANQSLAESLFSKERTGERNQLMAEKALVIAAWGVDKRLAEFKKQAVECLGCENIIGVKPDKEKMKAYYDYEYIKPLTLIMQEERIKKLAKCFKEYTSR